MPGKQRCIWHWLMSQPAHVQLTYANRRLNPEMRPSSTHRARVPKEEWPDGERWCASCQAFIPLFYCSGSRCKAHASAAAHAGRVQRVYGISSEDYAALLKFQGGKCYICHRRPRTLRLAVDHDHATGEVRGLLCANNENGCNRGVVANLEAAHDGGLAAARRAVEYLKHSPYRRMKGLPAAPDPVRLLPGPSAPIYEPPPF